MDWAIFLTSFGSIFLAELADKTEFAVIGLVSKTRSPWNVFFGAMFAFAIATLLAVFLGQIVSRFVPVNIIRTLSGLVFIIIGIFTLLGKF